MAFDPTATSSAPSSLGTLTDPQLAAIYGLDSHTAALPVRLKPAAAVPTVGSAQGLFGPIRQSAGLAAVNAATASSDASGPSILRYDQALGQLGTMSTDEIADLQRRLYAGGFFSRAYYGKRSPGVDLGNPDDAGTIHAFKQALNATVRGYNTGATLTDTINQAIASRQKNGLQTSLGSGLPPVTITLTNPSDVAAAAQAAATKIYGRAPSQQEIAGLTNAFHQQEITAQQAAQNEATTTDVKAADLGNFAEQYLRQQNPKAALTQNYADALGQVLTILGGK